jgi:hypothetical protein
VNPFEPSQHQTRYISNSAFVCPQSIPLSPVPPPPPSPSSRSSSSSSSPLRLRSRPRSLSLDSRQRCVLVVHPSNLFYCFILNHQTSINHGCNRFFPANRTPYQPKRSRPFNGFLQCRVFQPCFLYEALYGHNPNLLEGWLVRQQILLWRWLTRPAVGSIRVRFCLSNFVPRRSTARLLAPSISNAAECPLPLRVTEGHCSTHSMHRTNWCVFSPPESDGLS